ncbi:hypothetical protein [Nocardioides sp. URHA0020]|uniref:hypothetical protein n=1 Tax=Nocardioides sp. URHA0020 TaxID=1380392 RepID=UPI0004915050|nr:hypothetical protein [Nocardioides sp. URHA0020]
MPAPAHRPTHGLAPHPASTLESSQRDQLTGVLADGGTVLVIGANLDFRVGLAGELANLAGGALVLPAHRANQTLTAAASTLPTVIIGLPTLQKSLDLFAEVAEQHHTTGAAVDLVVTGAWHHNRTHPSHPRQLVVTVEHVAERVD